MSFAQTSRVGRPQGSGWRGYDNRYGTHRHASHRNPTLVLNHGTSTPAQETSNFEEAKESTDIEENDQDMSVDKPLATPTTSWISKRDRHMQLINASAFEINRALQDIATESSTPRTATPDKSKPTPPSATAASAPAQQPARDHFIEIDGSRFQVCNDGSKLQREKGSLISPTATSGGVLISHAAAAGPSDQAKPTPKSVVIHGIEFVRSKNGNLYRSGVVRERRSVSTAKAVREAREPEKLTARRTLTAKPAGTKPCKRFTRAGTFSLPLQLIICSAHPGPTVARYVPRQD